MGTEPATPPSWLHSLGVALGVGYLLAMAACLADFQCMPAFEQISGMGKGTAMLSAALFALEQPGLFYPVFAGFSVLTLICVRFPLLFDHGTLGRTLGALSVMALLFLGVLWMILLAPAVPCATWGGIRLLIQVGAVTLALLLALYVIRKSDRIV